MIVNLGMPIWVGVLIGLAIGVLIGALNGTLIAFLNIPSFIATLGTSGIFKAAALLTTGGNNIYNLPDVIRDFGNSSIAEIVPVIAIIMIAITVLAHIVLTKTKFGRYTYAIGSNEQSAKLSGIKVKKNLFGIYVLCGTLSSIAGIIMLCRLNSGVALAGQDYQMNSISAVVIGGGSLFGGEGTIVGAIIGAAIMTVLSNGMQLLGVSTYVQELLVGVVLIAAVFIDNIRRKNLA
jgi:ribose/xylose/arabinose/galactoside ABC-type transport system permease subunit